MQTNGSELLLRNARFFIKNVERVSQKSCRATAIFASVPICVCCRKDVDFSAYEALKSDLVGFFCRAFVFTRFFLRPLPISEEEKRLVLRHCFAEFIFCAFALFPVRKKTDFGALCKHSAGHTHIGFPREALRRKKRRIYDDEAAFLQLLLRVVKLREIIRIARDLSGKI